MFEAAYYCEIMRAGIQSIPRGQVWSGYALGLNYWQTMGHVVLPQAFRNMLPVLLTQTIILFQDTSLVYVISATDFLGAAAKIANRDYRLVEMYTFVAVVYFVISYGLSLLVQAASRIRIAIIAEATPHGHDPMEKSASGTAASRCSPTAPPTSRRARWWWCAAPRAAASRR